MGLLHCVASCVLDSDHSSSARHFASVFSSILHAVRCLVIVCLKSRHKQQYVYFICVTYLEYINKTSTWLCVYHSEQGTCTLSYPLWKFTLSSSDLDSNNRLPVFRFVASPSIVSLVTPASPFEFISTFWHPVSHRFCFTMYPVMAPHDDPGRSLPSRPSFSWDINHVPWADGKGDQLEYTKAVRK